MITAVITPTKRYGGLGEQYHWLTRQTHQDFTWIVADDLFDQRKWVMAKADDGAAFDIIHFRPKPKPKGYWSNLAGIYNEMLDIAHDLCADVVISLQDYILVPENGIQRMELAVTEKDSLVTGLTSYSATPDPEDVEYPEGIWTIFNQVYKHWPKEIFWEDVREPHYPAHAISPTNSIEWELNWAGIPGDVVRAGLRFDPEYGKAIAYENQDFAWRAYLQYDKSPYIDKSNHVLSMPHQLYWPEERAAYKQNTERNRQMHEEKYASVLRVMSRGKV